jgi:hypothetical protein
MKILVAAGIIAVAASTPAQAGPGSASDGSAVARPAAPGTSPDDAILGFPARLSAPGLDRAHVIANRLPTRRSAALTSKVLVCIVPTGAVTAVKLMKSSGAPSFDNAVLASANRWLYDTFAAPAGTRICTAVSVVYRAPPARMARRARPARAR